jgi:hypothetical protein
MLRDQRAQAYRATEYGKSDRKGVHTYPASDIPDEISGEKDAGSGRPERTLAHAPVPTVRQSLKTVIILVEDARTLLSPLEDRDTWQE